MTDDVNLTKGLIFLISWSALAGVWWIVAIMLVALGPRRRLGAEITRSTLSVFKPIPPTYDDVERELLATAIESFIAQLDSDDEVLIGIEESALPAWQSAFEGWKTNWPRARIAVVAQPAPSHRANPKVAWMEIMSTQAKGELWLWSDADVIAPPEFLHKMKNALIGGDANVLTAAYSIRQVRKAAGMLDALFVNVEFLPGALLLDRLNAKDFAYGAAMMFRAATFRERVTWADLGAELADDHELGRRLKPVAMIDTLVSTFTLPSSWRDTLEHYYRWQKTIHWCRPSGFAAMIVVIPMIGWVAALILRGGDLIATTCFLAQWLLETLVGIIICSLVGCRPSPRTWAGLLLWPLVRAFAWLAVWLPVRVVWGGRKATWSTPRRTV